MEQINPVHGGMLDEGERHVRLISVNVGLPREVTWKGKPVTTAIFKEPVQGPIVLRTLNLDGDRQADPSVHGGADKAVYVYPAEHYDYWRSELSGQELPWGSFGENFTTTGSLKERFISAIGSPSDRRRSSSHSRGCPATSSASSSDRLIW